MLVEHKVSARKFKTTQVDQFSGENVEIIQPGSDLDSDSVDGYGPFGNRDISPL